MSYVLFDISRSFCYKFLCIALSSSEGAMHQLWEWKPLTYVKYYTLRGFYIYVYIYIYIYIHIYIIYIENYPYMKIIYALG